MLAIFKKEINIFFNSLTAYIALFVYLIVNGVILWIFEGDLNILNNGYANLDTLFIISPWMFMFLIPAITMRMISEEKKTGTIEFLLTKPLSDTSIILGKYFASFTIVIISIIPSLVYYYSVYKLGNPVGSIDIGGTWGSYIGLVMLGSVFVSIGIFSSTISSNQIVSFILSVFICLIFYSGFDAFAELGFSNSFSLILSEIGINYHYLSISRGIIDSRDIIYFISITIFFILLTRLVFDKRKWEKSK